MLAEHPGFRIFILGAGFSKLAGLPLGPELFVEVRRRIERLHGRDTRFHGDLEKYIRYRSACDGIRKSENDVDLEEFMSFLDIEHYLQLRGSDTWSVDGNESQLLVRQSIGAVIQERTPVANELPAAYYEFARRLTAHDMVLTFNYDLVLERALEHVGKAYRLFPDRYKSVGRLMNVVDSDVEEVVVLKMHGSVDWFSSRQFLEITESNTKSIRTNTVFDEPEEYGVHPLTEGPRNADDSLKHVFRMEKVDEYYERPHMLEAPFLLSPSHVKFVYAEPLASFWHGMGRGGGYNLGISVIGFSLPPHDEYVRIGLFQLISNYQRSWWDEELIDRKKQNVKLVDFRVGGSAIDEFKRRYRFVDEKKAEYFFEGFNRDAVEFIFADKRNTASRAQA